MSHQSLPTLRGRVLRPRAEQAGFELLPDALIELDARGRIQAVGPAPADCRVPETHPGTVLLPGFVDTHIHFPQTRMIGSASGPLLTWLERSVFPEEGRFRERAYAEQVAVEFCDALIAQGTTSASIFSSSHPEATDALFAELSRRGLRAMAGLTLMDRGAPPAVLREAPAALEACETLIERWHGHDEGRLRFCVTPRFALSCTSELMRGAGRLAERHGLWMQTHLSENREELRATAAAFPGSADYLGVYEDHGLVGSRSLFAHCIHLSEGEWERMARRNAVVAHCPDSNFFLGSGCMPLRKATERGIRVGLGTDMGAGRTFSLRRVAASAYDAALVLQSPVTPEELLWRATAGGALALGLEGVGRIAPGYEADLVAVDVPAHVSAQDALVDALLFRRDAGPVRATYVRGRRLASGGLAPPRS
ncbi:guanine deaminase [Pyxidicoccus trucidator]|uniref:guanine deaminase n=1 Tax=Pyxidicoccus trucidator TaxID=2709662 RepID=UPI0013DCF804|nr:guanine deaminase [Pyxidicoccus trucidator]